MLRASSKIVWIACATTLLTVALGLVSWAWAQSKQPKTGSKAPAVNPVPFRAVENLEYRILFSKYGVNAGSIETSIVEERTFFGQLAWHFRATAHTMNTLRMIYAIDDQFDSYTSAAGLFSLQFEMYLHEQGKDQTSVFRMTTDSEPAPKDATALRVAPGTRDALGFLYNVRAIDWKRTPELRAPVFDGHHVYDVVARVDMPDGIANVPAGNLPASRVAIRVFDHDTEVTDTRVWLSIGRDAAHTPVLIEAELPFGSARVELMQMP